MGKRRVAREISLQVLYQLDITRETVNHVLAGMRQNRTEPIPDDVWEYARQLALGTVARQGEIDARISGCSENWDLERICLVDRNILRQAIWEMVYSPEVVPPAVCINEAIEIAKKFSSSISPAFINGILDRVKVTLVEGSVK